MSRMSRLKKLESHAETVGLRDIYSGHNTISSRHSPMPPKRNQVRAAFLRDTCESAPCLWTHPSRMAWKYLEVPKLLLPACHFESDAGHISDQATVITLCLTILESLTIEIQSSRFVSMQGSRRPTRNFKRVPG